MVAPFTGAWIEIVERKEFECYRPVAPFTGAWIEISIAGLSAINAPRRSLHGGVD